MVGGFEAEDAGAMQVEDDYRIRRVDGRWRSEKNGGREAQSSSNNLTIE